MFANYSFDCRGFYLFVLVQREILDAAAGNNKYTRKKKNRNNNHNSSQTLWFVVIELTGCTCLQ
jgi:hypothetical protein